MKRTEIKKLLPSVMQRSMTNPRLSADTDTYRGGSVLSTFIEVMEKMHEPTEHLLENLHSVFDPRQVPECFLPMLSHWTNLIGLFQPDKAGAEPSFWKERTLPTEPGYLRELIATSVEISRWRGTSYGLTQILQMATGVSNFSIMEGKKPFHIEVGVPEAAQKYWELIERIVEQEKPAHITAEVFPIQEYDQEKGEEQYYEDEDSEEQYYEDEDSEEQYYEEDRHYEGRKPSNKRVTNEDPKRRPSSKRQSHSNKKPDKPPSEKSSSKKAVKPARGKKPKN